MKNWQALLRAAAVKAKAALSDEKKRVNLLLLTGLAGMLLMAFSEWVPTKAESAPQTAAAPVQADYAADLESRLQALIARVEGAGETRVMVTLLAQEESVYATDTETAQDGTAATHHVLLGSGGETGLVETVYTPQVLGVAVVCQGGADAAVQNRITALVQALTGVGANHITVAAMAP